MRDGALTGEFVVFESYLDALRRSFALELVVEDVALLEQDLGDLPFEVGSRNLHHFLAGADRVAKSGQIVCYRICYHNCVNPFNLLDYITSLPF